MLKAQATDLNQIINEIKKEAKILEGKTLLISGGSGFIGSYINAVIYLLNKKLFKKPCKVISLDNYITGFRKNFLIDINDKNFQLHHYDVRLPFTLNSQVDFIIHAAGLASPYYYKKYPLETIESAILGAKNLKVFCFFLRARFMVIQTLNMYQHRKIMLGMYPQLVPEPVTMNQKG